MTYGFLLDIAIILLTTKVFGLVASKFHMPQVVGSIVAGLVFGPAMLNILQETEFLSQLAELGVIVIMFSAGLGTNLSELKRSGKAGLLVALLGVIVPLLGGIGFGLIFNRGDLYDGGNAVIQNIFLGVVLTATSVSITVETLKEMGRLNTRVGNTILAAALIDDILGLVCLTFASSLGAGTATEIVWVVLKIVLFFVFAFVVHLLISKAFAAYSKKFNDVNLRRFPILALVLCLLMAYCAEQFFGVAGIIGAFIAGITISGTRQAPYIQTRINPISYVLLTPIFFAHIGINIVFYNMGVMLIVATVVLTVLAFLSKLVGCGLGARVSGMSKQQSVQVGVGMICRGEVALIVVNNGMAAGLMPTAFMAPVVIMVIATAVFTPVLLKLTFSSSHKYEDMVDSGLADRHNLLEHLDTVSQQLLRMETEFKADNAPAGRRGHDNSGNGPGDAGGESDHQESTDDT